LTSKPKLSGENTQRRVVAACAKLRCTESQLKLSVSAAITGAGRESCPADDGDCISAELVPYIDAILAGKQTRLPITYIAGTGKRRPPPSKEDQERVAALA